MSLRASSDWQSESVLDSIRNSYNVYFMCLAF